MKPKTTIFSNLSVPILVKIHGQNFGYGNIFNNS